ncbi:MAG: permease-like cell division protein FtsX [Defluviitaleaceae bacterium]|nr:permease-like cell division protein FtsX [Defluviitaleaceae bacterium]
MRLRTIKYYIHEAIRSVIYNKFMSIASIFAVASSIFIVAIFFMIGANVEHFMGELEAQMAMSVRMDERISHRVDEDMTAAQITLRNQILAIPNVAGLTFVSREEALESMADRIGPQHIEGMEGDANPLRDSFTVELTDLGFHDDVERAILNLEHLGVAEVHSHAQFANTLSTISSIVTLFVILLLIVLAGISVIIITNTIRITVNARKTEINIMKYVGATDWFVRWPFVLEGVIIGLLGGAVPGFICLFAYPRVVAALNDILNNDAIVFLPDYYITMYVFPLSLILGVLIGLMGSITSVKKHLKV